MVGPVVQDDLFSILARFRSHKFALTADISKMYRQVRVDSSDINMQCILWRDSPQRPLEVFCLITVTYGTSSASYLATRCLQQLAQEENCNYPVGAKVLTTDFCVDDMLTGADTFAELQKIQVEIDQLLRRGGFPLSKWCSNVPELLYSIDNAYLEKFLENTDDHVIKTLGMIWHPELDIFRYSCRPTSSSARVTKRAVLSAISRLFDPLGLINPIIVKAKIFLQHLWSLKVSWDESLPQNFCLQLSKFYNELELVNRVQIPRYIFHTSPANIEFHIFADASMSAYGACAYVRCVYNETITCNLLTAKSRVAPLKTLSIPRLELCAALLAAELAARLYKLFRARIAKVYCWSDSSITLSWLSSSPSKWTVFVSNRVAKIQEITQNFQWKHISSVNNPADIVSRGASPAEFIDSKIWFHGPAFLRMPYHLWPESSFEVNREIPERRKTDVTLVSSLANDFLSSSKFSNSYLKFVNTFAYVYRFIHNSKIRSPDSVKRTFGPINLQEFERALMAIIRLIQQDHFREDYCRMSSKRMISLKSPLANLDPFIDNNDIIRVGGRLQNSYLENLHAGVQTLLSIIRTRFWPIGGKGIVKESIRHCVRCCRLRPKVMQQIMAQLPAPRVQPSPVFYHTGVDFCGPFYIKGNIRSRAPSKAYISLFICLSVKAVHMEVVMNLTTEALTKFISRRPHVAVIYSDNATNFVGGNRELKELKELFNAQQHCNSVQERCKADGIDWKFIPPRSPHFGGLWEAAIKQAKHHLRRTLGLESYSLDELQRIVCQVESILNSRPLTPLSNDINDLQALTPGHFIAGGKRAGIPSPRLADVDARLLTRWQHLQAKVQSFWSRWQTEYLQNLQQRVKWKTSKPNIEIGAMVILKEENMPPLMWRLGLVEDVHRGKDGHIRVVTVRTMTGLVKRAITKVCLLPVEDEGSPNELEAGTSKAAGSC